jgi:hypothetical protein
MPCVVIEFRKQRVAVRGRLGYFCGGDRAAGTTLIVDDDRLAERVCKLRR